MSGILTLPGTSTPTDPRARGGIVRGASTIAFVTEPKMRAGVEHRERRADRNPAGPSV